MKGPGLAVITAVRSVPTSSIMSGCRRRALTAAAASTAPVVDQPRRFFSFLLALNLSATPVCGRFWPYLALIHFISLRLDQQCPVCPAGSSLPQYSTTGPFSPLIYKNISVPVYTTLKGVSDF